MLGDLGSVCHLYSIEYVERALFHVLNKAPGASVRDLDCRVWLVRPAGLSPPKLLPTAALADPMPLMS